MRMSLRCAFAPSLCSFTVLLPTLLAVVRRLHGGTLGCFGEHQQHILWAYAMYLVVF